MRNGGRRIPRTPVEHWRAAESCRRYPGVWHLAGTYRATHSAKSSAILVRKKGYPAYEGPGLFEARTRFVEDETGVFVRFGGPSPAWVAALPEWESGHTLVVGFLREGLRYFCLCGEDLGTSHEDFPVSLYAEVLGTHLALVGAETQEA